MRVPSGRQEAEHNRQAKVLLLLKGVYVRRRVSAVTEVKSTRIQEDWQSGESAGGFSRTRTSSAG
jgi:hypothetical protein